MENGTWNLRKWGIVIIMSFLCDKVKLDMRYLVFK